MTGFMRQLLRYLKDAFAIDTPGEAPCTIDDEWDDDWETEVV